jgi:23S rRNA-/tRNA-specific pseudouridylate synthase
MLYNFFLLHHINGRKQSRENLKNILQNNNIELVRSKIDPLIQESNRYINNDASNDNAAIVDNKSLHHCSLHLEQSHASEAQKNAAIDALNE